MIFNPIHGVGVFGADVNPLLASPLRDNLHFLFDSDFNITLNSGNVEEWGDRGPNGFTMNQSIAAWQPAYVADVRNGHAAIRCSDDGLLATSLSPVWGTVGTIFVVFQDTNTVFPGRRVIDGNQNNDSYMINAKPSGPAAYTASNTGLNYAPSLPMSKPIVFGYRRNSTTGEFFDGTTLVDDLTTAQVDQGNEDQITISSNYAETNRNSNMDYYFLALFTKFLTDEELAIVVEYLERRYDI